MQVHPAFNHGVHVCKAPPCLQQALAKCASQPLQGMRETAKGPYLHRGPVEGHSQHPQGPPGWYGTIRTIVPTPSMPASACMLICMLCNDAKLPSLTEAKQHALGLHSKHPKTLTLMVQRCCFTAALHP